jgi:hypothetical protein
MVTSLVVYTVEMVYGIELLPGVPYEVVGITGMLDEGKVTGLSSVGTGTSGVGVSEGVTTGTSGVDVGTSGVGTEAEEVCVVV